MIFDTHAHYDDEQFDADRDELLLSMEENGVGTIVNVSTSYESCGKVVEMAQRYPFLYAAVGVHPDEVGVMDEDKLARLRELCAQEKVVAVGEIGLDYHWDTEPREVQKRWFIRQLELARELALPVMIHSRDAAADTLEIIRQHGQGLCGVIHCFSYSLEMAREYVRMGYDIGVGGVVTFKNGKKLREIVREIPLASLLLETDAPYLAPEPNRGKRNTSLNLKYVVQEIAGIKGLTCQEVIEQTEKNARRMLSGKED